MNRDVAHLAPGAHANPWINYRRAKPKARLRLFCFPHAGGGASVYRDWNRSFPPEIDVCPVQPPGRESRLREPAFRRINPLVSELGPALVPYLDMPFAMFGHSVGSVVAYETVIWLRRHHSQQPAKLLVSARRAPSAVDDEIIHSLPREQFYDKLRELNGTPEEVLNHPELMELMEPLLRSDFELSETYRATNYAPLDCPVIAYGGVADSRVSEQQLRAWSDISSGAFKLRMFPGGHFYLHEHSESFLATLAGDLMQCL